MYFTALEISDSGEYRCIASNKGGKDTTKDFSLIVYPDNSDSTGPTIQIISPSDSSVTSLTSLPIAFLVKDSSGIMSVSVNGTSVTSSDSIYRDTVLLEQDTNTVTINAVDSSNNSSTLKLTYIYKQEAVDTIAPLIYLISPPDSSTTNDSLLKIVFKATDSSGIASVTVNGTAVSSSDSIYNQTVQLSLGQNLITLIAEDASNQKNRDTLLAKFFYDPTWGDTTGPNIVLISPQNGSTTADSSLKITFKVVDPSGVSQVSLNGSSVLSSDSIYMDTVSLALGSNAVTIIAVDNATNQKNSDTLSAVFTYDPTFTDTTGPDITFLSPEHGAHLNTATVDVTVNVGDVSGVAWVTVNGGDAALSGNNYVKSITLVPGKNTLTVIAQDSSTNMNIDSSTIQVTFDNVKPSMRLLDPTQQNSSVKTDSVIIQMVATDNTGIKEVKFSVGVNTYPTSVFEDSIFYATIKNLVQDVFTEIKVSSIDTAENDSTMYVNVKYDPSLNDIVPPVITQLSGPAHGDRITVPQHTFRFRIEDQNGIDSAFYTVDDVFQGNLTYLGTDEFEFSHNFGTSYGQRVIKIYAVDSTTNQNQSFKIIQLNYNTVISAVTNTAPVQGAVNVELKPLFSWTGGSDPDGDVVTFKVYYGTAVGNLTETLNADSNTSIQASSNLTAGVQYFWKVTAYSATFPEDSVSSTVTGFTTWKPKGMRLIQASGMSFNMGTAFPEFYPAEAPVHTVSFTKDFWMDTTEVTQQVYHDVMTAAYSDYVDPFWVDSFGVGASYPAYYVGWYDAVAYCNAISKRDGLDSVYSYSSVTDTIGHGCRLNDLVVDLSKNGYRLPTEAEWEYACRANTTTWYYWGDIIDEVTVKQYCWYALNAFEYMWTEPHAYFEGTQHVATRLPNNFGIYDMSGNVAEWVNDWYSSTYYSESPDTDPPGPETGGYKVIRGGGWDNDKENIRSAYRSSCRPWWDHYYTVGFRSILPVHSREGSL